jgi:hypothetical protein
MLPDGDADHKFWREVVIAYRFPLVMVVLALVPILNFIAYSGMEESAVNTAHLFSLGNRESRHQNHAGRRGVTHVVLEVLQANNSRLYSCRASALLGCG